MLSPSTSGLFQRAISQSGSALNPSAYVDTASAQTRAQQLTQLLGYSAEYNNDIYNFLMGASSENITIQQSNVTTERRASEGLAFVPTAEKETGSGGEVFLPASPLEILKSGNFTRVPYIISRSLHNWLLLDRRKVFGAAHADDLGYLFTISPDHEELESNSTELTTVDRLVTLWTNFAKSQDLGEGLNLTWDPVEESKQTYLDINTNLSVHNLLELHPERRAVWDALYSNVDN
uniref:(California timema) hypothetical protein n=1 Tax=Timema californicum TaxID=61474 RepID=A0A7R9PDM9_TIMCA|nr:unnamed protein product [Timema californicum]